jgi:hypothetical protein
MPTTEYEIYTFILGAGAGSIVTYYNMPRAQRAIRAVRREIDRYGLALRIRKVDSIRENRLPEREREGVCSDERDVSTSLLIHNPC